MPTAVQTQTKPSNRGRGRGGNRGKGRGRGGNREGVGHSETKGKERVVEPVVEAVDTNEKAVEENKEPAEDDVDTCFICAEPVKYYSVSQCNHRTCQVCALRLRALYKKMECTFCKEPQSTVVFTTSADQPFASYDLDTMAFKDARLSIAFETQEMMEETLILLRFNCPDSDCDYIAKGWQDLKLHVRATHNKLMCDICIRNKKVFAHEHTLYTYSQLVVHVPSMEKKRHHHHKNASKEPPEGGIHPECIFCHECFFTGDELYSHMRERHEECFLCKRNEVRDQYFTNYDALEQHFNNAHHPCRQTSCQLQKFVVFNTLLDLKAHMVEEHGATMSARDMKDARRVQAEFEFEEVAGRGRGRRNQEREPPPRPQQQPDPPAAPPGPPRPPGGGRRRDFGATLTVEGGNPSPAHSLGNTPPGPSRRESPSPTRDDVDSAVVDRHTAFLTRLQSLAPNAATAVPAVKAATRSYRASESSARDLISTVWNVLDRQLDHTASIINTFVDLLDDEDKKKDLLSSWNGFEVEQRRQFPELVPTSVGSGYAAITSGRVLNAKHSTAARTSRGSAKVWDRVAQAASSSTSAPNARNVPGALPPPPQRPVFPPLSGSSGAQSSSPAPGPALRNPQHKTPWVGSNTGSSSGTSNPRPAIQPFSVPGPSVPVSRNQRPPPPKLNSNLFPELPSSGNARQKPQVGGNQSLRKILGTSGAPPPSKWGSGASPIPNVAGANGGGDTNDTAAAGTEEAAPVGDGSAPPVSGGGKGKKGKGKQKQTLFTLGSFPT
ncbi:hypothetical protein K435DRAFT_972354 [Dendrothele bispora CBS 962.96]|uniref:RING-type E3 ubiquitin transferase n=1 Tax=Dendrothele bispora (strain CBS 962.96) TaxID=1314807 RepID=A0A4S8KZC2_DENBC|nr:hypothetical protein K435DRAFT_972354 [Dendrothele bispora CBS 962.96]